MSSEVLKAAKVGALSLTLVACIYFGWRFLSPESASRGGYKVHAYLPDLGGVAPHSRVTIHGIPVGFIERIALDQGRARVDLRIHPEVALYEDAAIGRRASSLIGESVLVLTPGLEGTPLLHEGSEIHHLIKEPSLDALQGQVGDILNDVQTVTRNVSKTIGTDPGQKALESILQNLVATTAELRKSVQENRQPLRDTLTNARDLSANAKPQLSAILDDVRAVSGELRKTTSSGPIAPNSSGGEVHRTINHIEDASVRLDSTLQHTDSITARIDRGEGTLGRLTKDDTLIRDVEGVTRDVGQLVGGLSRLKTIVTLRSDYAFLSDTLKNSAELRLQPKPDRYYLLQLVSDPRGSTRITQRDVDTTNPNSPPHYRELLTETTNAFRFSMQFATRLGPWTGRFGLMESTGGLGLDLHLLGDHVELLQDLFGFSEQLTPRWRAGLAWELLAPLWLVAGVDDALVRERRDYFVGLRLRFDDPDLKPILPFVPSPR